eukprot:scaffold29328_cov57-Attheya_sp.AAC.1
MRDLYGDDPNPWGEPPHHHQHEHELQLQLQLQQQQGPAGRSNHNEDTNKDLNDVDNTTFLLERMAASANSSNGTSSTALMGEGSEDVLRYFNTSATSTSTANTNTTAASVRHGLLSNSHSNNNSQNNNNNSSSSNSNHNNNNFVFSPGFSALEDHGEDDEDDDPLHLLNTSDGLLQFPEHDQDIQICLDQEVLNDESSSQQAPHDTNDIMGQDEKQPEDDDGDDDELSSREPEHLVNNEQVDYAALMALETSKKKRDLDECHQLPSEPLYDPNSQQQQQQELLFLQNPSKVGQPRRHSIHSTSAYYYANNHFHRRASAGGGGSESIIHENSQMLQHMSPESSSVPSQSLSTHPHISRQHQFQHQNNMQHQQQQDHQVVGSLYRHAQELHHHHRVSNSNQILPATRRSSTGTVISTYSQDLSDYMDPSLFSSRETAKELTRALLIDDNSNNYTDNVNNNNNNNHNTPVVEAEEEDSTNNDPSGHTPISRRSSSASLHNTTPYTPVYNTNSSNNSINNNSHLLNTMSLYPPPPVMDEDRISFLSPEGASPSLAVNFPTPASRARKQQRRCSLPAMSLGYNGVSSSGFGINNNTNNHTQNRYKTPQEQEEALQEMLIYQQKVLAEMSESLKKQQREYQQQRESYEQQQQQQQQQNQQQQQQMGYTGQDGPPRDFNPPSSTPYSSRSNSNSSAMNAFAQLTLSSQTTPQQQEIMSTPTHTMSQPGMWATPDANSTESSSQLQTNGSPDLSVVIAERLANLMQKSSKTQVALQEWDKKNGLPKSHSQTMVKSARSRRQLIEGVILKKWDGSPLIGTERATTDKDGVDYDDEEHIKKMTKAARRMSAPATSYVRNVTPPMQVTMEEPLPKHQPQPLPQPTHLDCSKPQTELEESPTKELNNIVCHSSETVNV